MTIELTEEQRQALATESGEPVRLVDPKTRESFVILPSKVYEDMLEEIEDEALQKAWLERATQTRREWVRENPY